LGGVRKGGTGGLVKQWMQIGGLAKKKKRVPAEKVKLKPPSWHRLKGIVGESLAKGWVAL